jgi:hypothetical protein
LIFSNRFDMLISKINFKKLKQLLFWYIFKQKYTSKNNRYNNTKYVIDNPANLDFFSGNISTSNYICMYVCVKVARSTPKLSVMWNLLFGLWLLGMLNFETWMEVGSCKSLLISGDYEYWKKRNYYLILKVTFHFIPNINKIIAQLNMRN